VAPFFSGHGVHNNDISKSAQLTCNPACTDLLMNSDHKPKLDQSDLVYWIYRSFCLYSCAASWESQPMGCLLNRTGCYTGMLFTFKHCVTPGYCAMIQVIEHPAHQVINIISCQWAIQYPTHLSFTIPSQCLQLQQVFMMFSFNLYVWLGYVSVFLETKSCARISSIEQV